ncbi:MAG: tRNA adenosine(34) deaminase TadA [Pseudomonadota bacterium]
MTQAMMEAEQAFSSGEVPVGAVLADAEGRIVARAHNQPIALNDPTAHAEILVLRKAGVVGQNYRLAGSTLVVTIEPCLMCMGAAVNARIARLVFGAYDPKAGAAGSLYDVSRDDRLNHRIEVTAGIMEQECRALLRKFFRARRGN